jgi:M6 family metalloprotease-like protein
MVRRSTKFAMAALTCVCIAGTANAVPVEPSPQVVRQPDGSSLTVIPRGDEFNVFWELPSGHTVIKDRQGWWRLAGIDDNGRLIAREGLVAGRVSRRALASLPRHLRPIEIGLGRGELAPVPRGARAVEVRALGRTPRTQPVVVILVQFTDRAPVGATPSDFRDAFFGPGRSVAEYYHEATFGRLEMAPAHESQGTPDDGVVGWLQLDMPHPNYALSTASTATQQQKAAAQHNTRLAIKAAIEAANPYVDFAAYDANHDGAISSDELTVVVIMAGYEASYGGYKVAYSPADWGHHWALGGPDAGGVVDAPVVDGVSVADGYAGGSYATFGEWMQKRPGDGHRSTIGVMCHELGHDILGLPDLYDTDGSSEGIGAWGLMSDGAWGSETTDDVSLGTVPVLFCAWSRLATGIVDPIDLSGDGSDDASPAWSSGNAYRVGSGLDSEYFLLEYRTPDGFDAGLKRFDPALAQAGGLAIWHVDELVPDNSNDAHRKVDLEEANGADALDHNVAQALRSMLYYDGGVTAFADATYPSSRRYDAASSGVAITDVGAASDSGIPFTYHAPDPVGFPADTCQTAFDVPLAPGGARPLTEVLAQATGGDTPPLCAPIWATAWYKVTPGRSGLLSVVSGGFDTVAAVLTGSCENLAVAACDDDSAGDGGSRIDDVPVRRGVPLWVVIGQYGEGSGGGGRLTGQISLASAAQLTVASRQVEGCPELSWRFSVASGSTPVAGLTKADITLAVDGDTVPIDTLSQTAPGDYTLTAHGVVGGTAATHALVLQLDTADASGDLSASLAEAGTTCAGIDAPTQVLVIPAAAHLGGSGGTNWRTDLLASALGGAGSAVDLEVDYLEHGVANPSPPRRVLDLLPGGVAIGDAASSLFGVSAGKGALLVKWLGRPAALPCSTDCSPSLFVASRTFNLLDADNGMSLPAGSTFGQEIAAVPADRAIPAGGVAWMTGLVEEDGGDRTNLGLVALGGSGATVHLDFTDPTGASILSKTVSLAGWEYLQLDAVLGSVPGGVAVSSVRIGVTEGSVPVAAYASVVDGLTGDPVALLPVATPSTTWYIPSAAHVTGINDTNWRTDLSIFNPGPRTANVTLAFLEQDEDNSAPQVSAPLVLPAGASTRIVNVLPLVFNRSGIKGAIRVSSDAGVVVASRTYNLLLAGNRWSLPAGATFGQSVAGVRPEDGLSAGERGVVPGLVRDATYRSNLVALNMSAAALTVEADVLGPGGEAAGAPVTLQLRPFEYVQVDDVVGAAGIGGDLSAGTLVVRLVDGDGPLAVFVSEIDNRTGDPVTRFAQR